LVNSPRLRRRPWRGRLQLVVVASSSLAIILGASASAQADSLDQANAQAQQLAAQISNLQPQVVGALAAYDTSLTALGQAVSMNVAAGRVYSSLLEQADTLVAQRDSHIVALYKSGGSLALYASALRSGDPASLRQVPYLNGIVTSDADSAASALAVAASAKATLDASQNQIDNGLSNTDAVNTRLADLQNLLGQQQALLNQASARAKSLQALKDAAAALAASQAAAAAAAAQAAATAQPSTMPGLYRALYQAAAPTCPGLPWTVLAAIGQVETHNGTGGMVSSAGALGPMQFLPATFAEYARDGDHDGKANIMDPADAVYTAAAYLCANGGGHGGTSLSTAIWNYNHADWYVQLVESLAAKIS
jgi:predicted  nucleic acid-binding Zn-ribbon protein